MFLSEGGYPESHRVTALAPARSERARWSSANRAASPAAAERKNVAIEAAVFSSIPSIRRSDLAGAAATAAALPNPVRRARSRFGPTPGMRERMRMSRGSTVMPLTPEGRCRPRRPLSCCGLGRPSGGASVLPPVLPGRRERCLPSLHPRYRGRVYRDRWGNRQGQEAGR